ncbi:uncharacterized protein PgNI_04328 [Pyricularia grisea]|uniref:Uncharacterized protein n=1 Tax=Pyricularia grisea TaxID=148305 RepID=A0A6P8BCV3_PYRGI|nr:uncharacterized protein PgNI_04328 [Pyricularia grisea]TLD13701.1 hypothetical protein PgNI_04328 [Pyricularia grisea]
MGAKSLTLLTPSMIGPPQENCTNSIPGRPHAPCGRLHLGTLIGPPPL